MLVIAWRPFVTRPYARCAVLGALPQTRVNVHAVRFNACSQMQVGDGSVEFVPTPAESRALVATAYRVPFTMLVQFENDAIDETPDMARILSGTNAAGARSPHPGQPIWTGGDRACTLRQEISCPSNWQGACTLPADQLGGRHPFFQLHAGLLKSLAQPAWAVIARHACTRAGTSRVVLPGTHITPCGGDVAWQVGRSFSPVDALALGVKAVVQADIRRLGDRLIAWLENHT